MTELYLRQASVTIATASDSQARVINGLRINFKIDKTVLADPNKAVIRVYNCNADSRAAMEAEGARVLLRVGYGLDEDDQVQIFIGDIRRVAHLKQGPDWISEIEAGDGEVDYTGSKVDMSFPAGTPAATVLSSVIGEMQNVKNVATNLIGAVGVYLTPVVASGPVSVVMDTITSKLGLEWSIQDEEIQILKEGVATFDTAVFLSPETGMIGSPAKTLIGCQITSLLNTEFKPGRLVTVSSRDINGTFRTQSVAHNGDTFQGPWQTIVELETPN